MEKTETLDAGLMAIYFFIPFYGLRIALENYLMEDELEISYLMLVALISSLSLSIYITVLKAKTVKIKIIGIVILLVAVIAINLVVI